MKKIGRKVANLTKGRINLPVFIAAFAVVGAGLLLITRAATNSVSTEVENANLAGGAVICDDPTASNGKPVSVSGSCVPVDLYDAACKNTLVQTQPGIVQSSSLNEISGLVASRKQNDVYWVHNDSGDTPRIFAVNSKGETLGIFNLTGSTISAWDYEDIAIGHGPVAGQDYIYVADIGDNSANRPDVRIYRIAEPTANISGGAQSVNAERVYLKYPDGAKDSEAFIVDPRNGDWYLVQKNPNVVSNLYKVAGKNLAAGSITTMTKTSTQFALPASSTTYEMITAADMSADANYLALRTYSRVHLYKVNGLSVENAFKSASCNGKVASESQGEAIGFRSNNAGYLTISEGTNKPVNAFDVQQQSTPVPTTAVWADEFDGSSLSSIWSHESLTFNYGPNSGQKLANVNLSRNAVVSNGTLKLNAVKESYNDGQGGTAEWTSAQIRTKDKAWLEPNQRIEVRARWPINSGLRPALWMSSQDGAVAEIDFPEYFGFHQRNHWAMHWLYSRTVEGSKIRIAPELNFASTDWHTYAVEWQTTPYHAIRFYQDETKILEYGDGPEAISKWSSAFPGADPASPTYPQPWTDGRKLFVRLGLQIGGTYGGTIDPSMTTATMEVDYVRVTKF